MEIKCYGCKHAIIMENPFTGERNLECKLQIEQANNASMKELIELIQHPEKRICEFQEGKAEREVIYSYDD